MCGKAPKKRIYYKNKHNLILAQIATLKLTNDLYTTRFPLDMHLFHIFTESPLAERMAVLSELKHVVLTSVLQGTIILRSHAS